jgi:NAD(P)H-dependent FMN reductase
MWSEAMPVRLLAVAGSLRSGSTNSALIDAASAVAPDGIAVTIFEGIGGLPFYNPDDDVEPLPASVIHWRAAVNAADGLLVSCPEYARGIPGVFKNALDWLVGNLDGSTKPAALWSGSPRAVASQEQLRVVMATLSAGVVEVGCLTLPLLGRAWTAEELIADAGMRDGMVAALRSFAAAIG